MPKDYIENVLSKLELVKDILEETYKIKESLTSSLDQNELKDVLERTKVQVEILLEKSASIKELFFENYEKVLLELNQIDDIEKEVNGQQNGTISDQEDPLNSPNTPDILDTNHKEDTPSKDDNPPNNDSLIDDNPSNDDNSSKEDNPYNDDKEKEQEVFKPTIKLVDISKLVEPRKSNTETIKYDESVVVISSSDDEGRTQRSKSVNSKPAKKPTELELQPRKSAICGPKIRGGNNVKRKVRSKARPKSKKPLETFELSDTSSSLSDSVPNSEPPTTVTKTNIKNKEVEASVQDYKWKDDPKFKSESYVKVFRVQCEKLKEYYTEKLELLEIKKLTRSNSSKRRRERNSNMSSEEESRKAKRPKRSLPKNKSFEQSDSDTDDEAKESSGDEAVPTSGEVPTAEQGKAEIENSVEVALDLLDSEEDKNKDTSDSEDEEQEKKKNNKKAKKSRSGKDKEDTEDDQKKGSNNEENKEKRREKSSEESDSDQSNKKKRNSSWKKDKLLTGKLTDTDSDDQLQKFKKKKKKIQREISSDEEVSVPTKDKKKKRVVKKRLKRLLDSNSSSDDSKKSDEDKSEEESSSSEAEKEQSKEESKNKGRKRVKRIRDSSEDDENDKEKSSRRNIRNIWGKDSLAETTKQAEAQEKERKARIAEKQKKYNQIYEFNLENNAKVEKVVLDFDEETKEELLKVDDSLVAKLKPHQASGVQFMWDACYESLERAKSTQGSGCILAHCMGLGKTLQVIALVHTLLTNSKKVKIRKVLIVCPLNTVLNWINEFKIWLPDNDDYEVFELVSFKQNYERLFQTKEWHNNGGVLIIGYDMFRNLSNPENKRISKKMRHGFQEALVDPGADLVICDEGHLLKNEKTNLSIAMTRLKTLRRIVLTGTPLQNNLKEYFCMVQFVKPNLLGTYKEYLNRFVNPITNGQYTDSTLHDIQVMRRRSHVLHKLLDGVVQRRDYAVLQPYLPPKHEYVLFLNLTEVQIKLYRHYLDHFAQRRAETSILFADFQALQRICTHPRVLLDKKIENLRKQDKFNDESESEGSLKDFINDEDEESTATSSNSNSSGSDSETASIKSKKKNSSRKTRVTRAAAALAKENGEEDPVEIPDVEPAKEWWQQYCDDAELDIISHGSKLTLLFEILKECEQIGDKILIFSQSLYTLNIIEYFLEKISNATEEGSSVGGYSGSWVVGLDYFRLDGSSSCDNRNTWCKTFNDPDNTRARLFLISTKAGGLGINLIAANRVIIFDVSWNPSHDVQSIYRVYRFGQTKPCYVYRFVTNGTMEMKIYERQVTKQAIAKRVIDEQQIDRHYNQSDLQELYTFDPNTEDRPTPMVPKDVLLGELLQKFQDLIFKYHEHQSLLENKEEECLNEEERKAAWEEFENEKKQRSYLVAAPNTLSSNPNVITALISLVRKENPSWDDTRIRSVIPALQLQLQEQLSKGDLAMYQKIVKEIQLLKTQQEQKLREEYFQRILQQQQQQFANANYGNYFQNMPGTSRPNIPQTEGNVREVIDLND